MGKSIEEREREKIQNYVKRFGPHLYHYTSFNAFYGIVKNKEIWLGSAASMNDKDDGRDLLKKIKKALLKEAKINKLDVETLFTKINSAWNNDYGFTFSLSMAKDDAAQWERYASNARGVCISFNTEKLAQAIIHINGVFSEIIYDNDIQKNRHYQILRDYLLNGTFNGEAFEKIEDVISNLIESSIFYKHNSFSAEREVRISSLWHEDIKYSQKDYLPSDVQIREVMKLNIGSLCDSEDIGFESLIDEIIIGPRSLQSKVELQHVMRSLKCENLADRIRESKCPLR